MYGCLNPNIEEVSNTHIYTREQERGKTQLPEGWHTQACQPDIEPKKEKGTTK